MRDDQVQARCRAGEMQGGCARKDNGAERDGNRGRWGVLPVDMPLGYAPVEFWKKKMKRKTTRPRWRPPLDSFGIRIVTTKLVMLPEAVVLRNAGRGL